MCKDSNDTVAREPYLSTLAQADPHEDKGRKGEAVVPEAVVGRDQVERYGSRATPYHSNLCTVEFH